MKDYYPGVDDSADEIKTDSYIIGAVSASTNYIVFDAPSDCQITKIKLTVDTAIAISESNYFSIQAVNQTQNDADTKYYVNVPSGFYITETGCLQKKVLPSTFGETILIRQTVMILFIIILRTCEKK